MADEAPDPYEPESKAMTKARSLAEKGEIVADHHHLVTIAGPGTVAQSDPKGGLKGKRTMPDQVRVNIIVPGGQSAGVDILREVPTMLSGGSRQRGANRNVNLPGALKEAMALEIPWSKEAAVTTPSSVEMEQEQEPVIPQESPAMPTPPKPKRVQVTMLVNNFSIPSRFLDVSLTADSKHMVLVYDTEDLVSLPESEDPFLIIVPGQTESIKCQYFGLDFDIPLAGDTVRARVLRVLGEESPVVA